MASENELVSSSSAGVRVQSPPLPTTDLSKIHSNIINILIPDLLLTKGGVGRTLLFLRDQVFLMYHGISSN
jgi:hypothetical protein